MLLSIEPRNRVFVGWQPEHLRTLANPETGDSCAIYSRSIPTARVFASAFPRLASPSLASALPPSKSPSAARGALSRDV